MKTWRMIFSGASDGFFNMALDEALLISCQQGASTPVLRLYQWNPPAVSLGYFQSTKRAVDLRKCRERGVDVVRRITGGRAVLHQDEITYSVCASTSDSPELGENVQDTYRKLSRALLEFLRVLGIQGEWVRPSAETRLTSVSAGFSVPCFLSSSRYELTADGRKLMGSAQRRFSLRSGQRMKESSIPLGKGQCQLAELLPDEGSTDQLQRELSEKSTHLDALLGRKVSPEEMTRAFRKGFEKTWGCRMETSTVRENELQMARRLARDKYGSDQWNLRR